MDSYTRFTLIYFLKVKFDLYASFLHFKAQAELQLNTDLLVLQTDWGGEYRKLNSYLNQHGVIFRQTCPYTSEQNGIVERKHRHVVETGLTLLAQAGMPFIYWTEVLSTAVHLINRLPTQVLNYLSPFEALYNIKPNYTHFKIFGCLCYRYIRPYNSHKTEFRSSPCVFLGYSPRHKGFKCLHSFGKIYISRHVNFDEKQFPFTDGTYSFSPSFSTPSKSSLPGPIPIYSSNKPAVSSITPLPSHPLCSTPLMLTPHSSFSNPISTNPTLPPPPANSHPMIARAKMGSTNLKFCNLFYLKQYLPLYKKP